jgi:hypothetical protein
MSSRIGWLVRITRTFLSLDTQQDLFPFVLSQALPWAFGYYGNSVALSLAAGRRSRLYDCETVVRLGLPFVSFNSLFESRSLGRALRMHDLHTVFPCHRAEVCYDGCASHHCKLGFNQCRFDLYPFRDFLRTGLAVRRTTYLRA